MSAADLIALAEPKASTWAVASDYSCVIETPDRFGCFPTELEALEHQIGLLEGEIFEAKVNLRRAKARRARILRVRAAQEGEAK